MHRTMDPDIDPGRIYWSQQREGCAGLAEHLHQLGDLNSSALKNILLAPLSEAHISSGEACGAV